MDGKFIKFGEFDSETETVNWLVYDNQLSDIINLLYDENLFESDIDVSLVMEDISGTPTPYINISGSDSNGDMFDNYLIFTELFVIDDDIVLPYPGNYNEIESVTVKCTSTNCQGCIPTQSSGCTPCDGDKGTCNQDITATYETVLEKILNALEKVLKAAKIFI